MMKCVYAQTSGLLATAVLAMTGMSTAQAYEWQITDNAMFGIGGDIELAYAIEDKGDYHERDLFDNGSEIDFFGEYTFTDDVSVYFEADFEYVADDDGDDPLDSKDVYAGLTSKAYGTVQVGSWDGIYDDKIDDLLDVFEVDEAGGSTEDYRTESNDAVAYFSPSFNGFSFAMQGFFTGITDDSSRDDDTAFQAVVQYEGERFGVYVGYDDNGTDNGADGTIGVGASIEFEPVTLAAKFETFGGDASPDKACDDEYCAYEKEGLQTYGVAVIYDYGPGIVQGVVNQIEPEENGIDSRTTYGVYVNYEITDDLYIYLEHLAQDNEANDDDYTATGLVYSF